MNERKRLALGRGITEETQPAALPGGPTQEPRQPRVWLVAENNPYQTDPIEAQRYALYFEPPQSAGGRLCRQIFGMDEREYLRAFERRNLLHQPKWSVPAAREAARALQREMEKVWRSPGNVVVLLGRKVFDAWQDWRSAMLGNRTWDGRWAPFTALWWQGDRIIFLPHPSGLCREWNAPGTYARARALLVEAAPHLAGVVGVAETTCEQTAAERKRMVSTWKDGRPA